MRPPPRARKSGSRVSCSRQAVSYTHRKAVAFATDAITQYGDELTAIVCDNDDMSSAVQAYCNSVNRSDIVCIGVDGNKGPLTMVKEGTLGATVFQDGVAQLSLIHI